jgi:hypothetical protein
MGLPNDLENKVSMLSEVERVEYNRRLQSAKALKEFATALATEGQKLTKLVNRFSQISLAVRTVFLALFGSIFMLIIDSAGHMIWLAALMVLAIVVLLFEFQKNAYVSRHLLIDQHWLLVERDWASMGLEASFLHAILEIEAAMRAKESDFHSVQNISSGIAEQKRTLSHFDYQLRQEILLNIESEKNWWSKIDLLPNQPFNLK